MFTNRAADSFRPRSRAARPSIDALEPRALLSTLPSGYAEVTIARGLNRPTALAFTPDGRILVTEQTGQLRIVQSGQLRAAPALQLNVDSSGERGLLGVAVDPRFSVNRFVYVYYTVPGAHNRVSRFTLVGNTVARGSERALIDLPKLGATNHNGGALVFGNDGKLYVGVGENAVPSNSQSLSTPLGKVLRINTNGSIPTDNPFQARTTGLARAIWAYGLRNPFTAAVDRSTGRIFINDVGQNDFEKVEPGVAGGNYGWAITENPAGDPRFVQPVHVYEHGPNGANGCAVTGGAFESRARPLVQAGGYFFADFCGNYVKRLDPTTGRATTFAADVPSRPVGLAVDSRGALLVLSQGADAGGGSITIITRRPVPRGPRG